MADTEKVVRLIVAQADINVITRRLVRNEYSNLTGAKTLSADQKKEINAVLDKIIAEIAQKMQPVLKKTGISDKMLQKENSSTKSISDQSIDDQKEKPQTVFNESFIDQKEVTRPQSVCNPSLANQKEETQKSVRARMFINESNEEDEEVPANGRLKHKSTGKSFALTHSECNNKVLEQRQIYTKNTESKNQLMAASVALMHVLNSDDASSDNSRSDFFNSPQKKAATGDRLLKGVNVRSSPGRGVNHRGVKRNVNTWDSLNTAGRNHLGTDVTPDKKNKTCDPLTTDGRSHMETDVTLYKNNKTCDPLNCCERSDLETNVTLDKSNKTCDPLNCCERSDLETNVTPDKSNKTCGLDFSNACAVNNGRNLVPTHSVLNSESEKNVYFVSPNSTLNSVNERSVNLSPSNSGLNLVNRRNVNVSPFNSSLQSANERNVHNFYKELYSKGGISYTSHKGCGRRGSLDFLQVNGQKCIQDCVIDSSSDNYDAHLQDANLLKNLDNLGNKDKFNRNVKHEKEEACVLVHTIFGNESYQEHCVNTAKEKESHGLDEGVQKQAAERVCLPAEEGLKSSSSGPSPDALFASGVASLHQRGVEEDSLNFVPTTQIESSVCHDSTSSDSSSCFLNIRRRTKSKIRTRKRICDDSDSDFQLSGSPQKKIKPYRIDSESDSQLFGSPQKITLYKPKHIDTDSDCRLSGRPKKNTAHKYNRINSDSDCQLSGSPQKNKSCKPKINSQVKTVMMKTVDNYDSDVEVIKSAVISDSELLERIEYKFSQKTFPLWKRKERKKSERKHLKSKKQISKTPKRHIESCNAPDLDLDESLEHFSCSESLKLSHDLNQTPKSTESSVYDLSDDDEFNVPLSALSSYRNFSAERNALRNRDRKKENKCSVRITIKEKQFTDCVQNNYIESTNQLDPQLQGCHLNSNNNIWKSFQNNPWHTTEFELNDGLDLMNGDSCRSDNRHSNCDEDVPPSLANIPDSNDSTSRLSDNSSVCSSQRKTTQSITKKSDQDEELANLRIICHKVGLLLRNTVELAGCSTVAEKVTRVKQLLNERGMQGKPSLHKVEKVNLLKEMKELKHDAVILGSQIEGRRRNMNEGPFGNCDDSYREHHDDESIIPPSQFSLSRFVNLKVDLISNGHQDFLGSKGGQSDVDHITHRVLTGREKMSSIMPLIPHWDSLSMFRKVKGMFRVELLASLSKTQVDGISWIFYPVVQMFVAINRRMGWLLLPPCADS